MRYFVRPVRPSDIDDIREIALQTWDGQDYIPSVIDYWLHDPDCITLGIESDGRLVAFCNLHLIEDGCTGWIEGLRTHPQWRGHGLANTLVERTIDIAWQRGVKRVRYTTDLENTASRAIAHRVGMRERVVMGVAYFTTPTSDADTQKRSSKINESSPAEVFTLLNSVSDNIQLLSGVLVYDWKVVDPTETGLVYAHRHTRFWTTITGERLTGLSTGKERREGSTPQWSFAVYASDFNTFHEHVLFHLNMARLHDYREVVFIYPLEYETRVTETILTPYNATPYHLILFEKEASLSHPKDTVSME